MGKQKIYSNCNICPRNCNINRDNVTGVCKVGEKLKIARAALHYWEEPCISGKDGSGAVFFSGCSLHCVYCQNEEISRGRCGKEVPDERLAEIFMELEEKGANNINLVTPGQYVPHIIAAVQRARNQGLKIPVLYNTSAYEKVESLKALEGIVDVYLPDFKYMDPQLALRYSHAPDYPQVAKAAIAEMVRQQPEPEFYHKQGNGELIGKGVIVRQLLLPGFLADAKRIVRYLHKTYGNRIYISMMSQYTPLSNVKDYPELNRRVLPEAYAAYIDYACSIGVEQGFFQEGEAARESFIPDFNCEGV